jgi:serine palmitoyltransferase
VASKHVIDWDEVLEEERQKPPIFTTVMTLFSYVILMVLGHMRETYRKFFPKKKGAKPGYAALVRDYDDFYQRRLYTRIRDCWNRPIDSRPSRVIGVMERTTKDFNQNFTLTGRILPCINLGSYNYLGFAEDTPHVTSNVLASIDQFGIAACSPAVELGQSVVVSELEGAIAKFVGKEDAIVCGMGFATNFAGLPALFCKDTLVFSDSLNHASLVAGVRMSGCRVKVFPHNDFRALEKMITNEIISGQPRTHKRYKRIVLLVEGIYSMEGQIVNLAALIAIKKRFKLMIYVDEAHSIGAIGEGGHGICQYCNVDPAEIDVLMGTFTKSFGSIGGYIASDKTVIDYIRGTASISTFCEGMSAVIAQQALSSIRVIEGRDGSDLGKRRIDQLAENSRFFRQGLIKLGLMVYGADTSPVIPVMLYNPGKMPAFSRMCLERGLAVVVVGYPATSLIESRVRFCISANHTREDLQQSLDVIDEIADEFFLRYRGKPEPKKTA